MSRRITAFGFAAIFVCLVSPITAAAQVAPALGNAKPYAVLGGSGVTNTGTTVVTGQLGTSPTRCRDRIPSRGRASGHDPFGGRKRGFGAERRHHRVQQPCRPGTTSDLTGQDLGGMTLVAGVYNFATSAQLTGTLTLNAAGNPNAVFIFKIGSTLTTASGARVLMIGGGSACNVFWQVGSSATLGTSTSLLGNILALTSITLNTTASVVGRTLARNGAVTLDTNTVSASACTGAVACPVISIAPPTLPAGAVGSAYSQQLTGAAVPGRIRSPYRAVRCRRVSC
jgi:hypothetical protein